MSDEKILYRIETGMRLGSPDPVIEVYGDGSMGSYEWRLMKRGQVEHDTRDMGYGNPDIALRDALLYVYGPPDELEQLDRAIGRARRGETPEP